MHTTIIYTTQVMSINIHNAYMHASYSSNRLDEKVNSCSAEGRSLYIPTHWSAKFLSTGICNLPLMCCIMRLKQYISLAKDTYKYHHAPLEPLVDGKVYIFILGLVTSDKVLLLMHTLLFQNQLKSIGIACTLELNTQPKCCLF